MGFARDNTGPHPSTDHTNPDGVAWAPLSCDASTAVPSSASGLAHDAGAVAEASSSASEEASQGIAPLDTLPRHKTDYATLWYHQHDGRDISSRVRDYNTYLAVLEELETGKLELVGADAREIGKQIRRSVLSEFRQHNMQAADVESNLYHRALFAFCIKRAIEAIKEGRYSGSGTTGALPEVAAAIEARINELFFNSAMAEGD